MKYKITSWETGTTDFHFLGGNTPKPCIMATALCTPSWLARKLFNKQPFQIDCYWDNTHSWWYNTQTGKELKTTSYGTPYDIWGGHKHIGDFLNNHKRKLKEDKKARDMVEKIKTARKS